MRIYILFLHFGPLFCTQLFDQDSVPEKRAFDECERRFKERVDGDLQVCCRIYLFCQCYIALCAKPIYANGTDCSSHRNIIVVNCQDSFNRKCPNYNDDTFTKNCQNLNPQLLASDKEPKHIDLSTKSLTASGMLPMGLIAGAIVLLVAICLIWYCCRRSKSSSKERNKSGNKSSNKSNKKNRSTSAASITKNRRGASPNAATIKGDGSGGGPNNSARRSSNVKQNKAASANTCNRDKSRNVVNLTGRDTAGSGPEVTRSLASSNTRKVKLEAGKSISNSNNNNNSKRSLSRRVRAKAINRSNNSGAAVAPSATSRGSFDSRAVNTRYLEPHAKDSKPSFHYNTLQKIIN